MSLPHDEVIPILDFGSQTRTAHRQTRPRGRRLLNAREPGDARR